MQHLLEGIAKSTFCKTLNINTLKHDVNQFITFIYQFAIIHLIKLAFEG